MKQSSNSSTYWNIRCDKGIISIRNENTVFSNDTRTIGSCMGKKIQPISHSHFPLKCMKKGLNISMSKIEAEICCRR